MLWMNLLFGLPILAAALPTNTTQSPIEKRNWGTFIVVNPVDADRWYLGCPIEIEDCYTNFPIPTSTMMGAVTCKHENPEDNRLYYKVAVSFASNNRGLYVRAEDIVPIEDPVEVLAAVPNCRVGIQACTDTCTEATGEPGMCKLLEAHYLFWKTWFTPARPDGFHTGTRDNKVTVEQGPNRPELDYTSFCVPHSDENCQHRSGHNIEGSDDAYYWSVIDHDINYWRCW